MKLRAKFIGIYTLIFVSVLLVVAVSLQTQRRLQHISDALSLGTGLLEQSRLVRRITNDVMIASFAPETYANLKDVLYFESIAVALRSWAAETESFKVEFREFMDNSTVRDLVNRGVLKNEHETAEIMSQKAFARLDSLNALLLEIRNRGLLGDDLYERIQQSSDPDLIALFGEARQTSYYLANSFESFLSYFIDTLSLEAETVRGDTIRSFIVLGFVTALVATLVTLFFSSRIVRRLRSLGQALSRTAAGDFSTPLTFDTRDEFRDLARSFNAYSETLKINLDSMVSLARDVADQVFSAEREAGVAGGLDAVTRVLQAVTEIAVRGRPNLSSVLVSDRTGSFGFGSAVVSDSFREGRFFGVAMDALAGLEREGEAPARKICLEDGSEILAGPLIAGDRFFGVLAVGHGGVFNDLDLIRFGNYVEFAGVLADNAATYAALAEQRNAEYLALQSQIQPHFLYNVLGGFAALNRMGERDTLERSIIALKELLRYAVDHDDQATLAEELNFIRRYCELQKMRFQERLSWAVTADESLVNMKIPKLLLQPLVENAIIHGIEPTGEPGVLEISAARGSVPQDTEERTSVVLTVRDNGAGFDPRAAVTGIGLKNVERRLALSYPDGTALLLLKSEQGKGSESILVLPGERP